MKQLNETSDISDDQLAEIFALQIALDSYKTLLQVEDMENIDFFDYIGFYPVYPDDKDTTDLLGLDDLSYEEYENLLNISYRLSNYTYELNNT